MSTKSYVPNPVRTPTTPTSKPRQGIVVSLPAQQVNLGPGQGSLSVQNAVPQTQRSDASEVRNLAGGLAT